MVNTLNDNKQHLIIYLVMASLIAVVLVNRHNFATEPKLLL
ncbi:hypothetical protein VIAG107301_00185 [Vibrio agarivorans]